MKRPLRIGLFPYLNVQPLVFGLSGRGEFEIILDLPSRIADRYKRAELELAMIPSLEAASLETPILEAACIASNGRVETVILHHRVPLAHVRTLALDEASRTSAALARILIREASGLEPDTVVFTPASGAPPPTDAILVIGDPAFTFEAQGYARLDLGAAWRARHGLPFVFAVLAASSRAVAREASPLIREALAVGRSEVSAIARSYNGGIDPVRAERYLREVIRYDLGPEEKRALALFHGQAKAGGLVDRLRELEFHAI